MQNFLDLVRQWALGVGGPGLFVIALLDSSFLSFPQLADALILLQSARHPDLMPVYAGMATLGSVIGCLMLQAAGRRGGEVFLRRRFKATHVDRAFRLYHRFGLAAICIPALLPPPAPFKVFVLLSGAARVNPLAFALTVGAARGARYFGQGYLAVAYGDEAADIFARHGTGVFVGLALAGAAAVAGYVAWDRRRRSNEAPVDLEPAGPVVEEGV
jgi:membrane protein YqaA with SNARE-associated domain